MMEKEVQEEMEEGTADRGGGGLICGAEQEVV